MELAGQLAVRIDGLAVRGEPVASPAFAQADACGAAAGALVSGALRCADGAAASGLAGDAMAAGLAAVVLAEPDMPAIQMRAGRPR